MNAIVTGGTGFLGKALVRELACKGYVITALVRPNSRRLCNLNDLPCVNVVETTLDSIPSLPCDKYDVFYHLAWGGNRNDSNVQFTNVGITLSCLYTAAKHKCKRFICTGSQAEYGEASELITEEKPVNPITSYGAAKVAAYYLSRDLAVQLGIEHVWTRVFSVYGDHDNSNTLYTQLITALRNGTDYSLSSDGRHTWNYLHETDAARALRRLSEEKINAGIYNVASRESQPLYLYVDALIKKINPSANITYGSVKENTNLNVCVDKLRNTIGEYEQTIFPCINV